MTVMSYVPFSVEIISVVLLHGVHVPLDAVLFLLKYLLNIIIGEKGSGRFGEMIA